MKSDVYKRQPFHHGAGNVPALCFEHFEVQMCIRDRSSDFKDRLTDLYNRTFNCYVRPKYDGTHQEFPDLDLKGQMCIRDSAHDSPDNPQSLRAQRGL